MAPLMRMFCAPKSGQERDDYEDAFAASIEVGRYAIADGAAESSFAEKWAKALVQAWTSAPPTSATFASESLADWLKPLQAEWWGHVGWQSLPWFAIEKAQSGAFAAFLGVEIFPVGLAANSSEDGGSALVTQSWWAVAMGDSCLFHLREGALIKAFPLEQSESFGNRPLLLSSIASNNGDGLERISVARGSWELRDSFLLATDALAAWVLSEYEGGRNPWKGLLALSNDADFETFLRDLRCAGSIRNDDTTLAVIQHAAKPFNDSSELKRGGT